MAIDQILLLAALMFFAAAIYSSVGHAGASGYLAAMALFGLSPLIMRPTALTLNILVAVLGTYRLHKAGLVNWRAMLPLVAGSIPFAFIGGAIQLPGLWYRTLLGIVLLIAAAKLFFQPKESTLAAAEKAIKNLPVIPAFVIGALIGLLSGLTGTGGGIFLSPLLLFFGWASARQSSGITAPFILVNSIAGLAGNYLSLKYLPPEIPWFAGAALLGALVGTYFGIRRFSGKTLQRILAVVMVIAAAKFLLT